MTRATHLADFARGIPGAFHFGATLTQVAVDAMIAELGYVRVFAGACPVGENVTIHAPLIMDTGAFFNVATGRTLTIRGSIEAPRQHIFRGAGSVVLAHHTSGQGEQAREVHISWFGGFPSTQLVEDQGPIFTRAMNALGNTREGIIHCDIGNYWMGSGVTGNRSVIIQGAGRRLTVFKVYADGFATFASGAILFRIRSCNFELDYSTLTTRTSPFVLFTHNECGVEDVRFGEALIGADLAGQSCYARDCTAVYGAYPGVGSSIIRIRGSGSYADNIRTETSASFGPDQMVDIAAIGANIDSPRASNIYALGPSKLFRILAAGGNVTNPVIDTAQARTYAGTPPTHGAEIAAEGTFYVRNFRVSGINIPGFVPNGILIRSNSSGGINGGLIDETLITGSGGVGIDITRTNGGVEDITVSSSVYIRERGTPIGYTGSSINRIMVSPGVLPDTLSPVSHDLGNFADDTTRTINLRRSVFVATLMVTYGAGGTNPIGGIYGIRAATTPRVGTIVAGENITIVTSDLDETTAGYGALTVCILPGQIKLVNRLGGTRTVSLTLMTGTP